MEKGNTKTGERSREISGGHWATGSSLLKPHLFLDLTVTYTNDFFLLYQPSLVVVESTGGARALLNLERLSFLFSNRLSVAIREEKLQQLSC